MPTLGFVNSKKSATELEDPAVLTKEILDDFDYSDEASTAIEGIIKAMIERGVFYAHKLEGDWEHRLRHCLIDVAGPVHVVGADEFTEICIRFTPESLPVGMQADLDRAFATTFDSLI